MIWTSVRVIEELMSSPTYTSGPEFIIASASLSVIKQLFTTKTLFPYNFSQKSLYDTYKTFIKSHSCRVLHLL